MTNEMMSIDELIVRLDEKKNVLAQSQSSAVTMSHIIGICDDIIAMLWLLKENKKIGFCQDPQNEENKNTKEEVNA